MCAIRNTPRSHSRTGNGSQAPARWCWCLFSSLPDEPAAASGAATVPYLGFMQCVVLLSAPLAFLRGIPGFPRMCLAYFHMVPLYSLDVFCVCISYLQSLFYFCGGFVLLVNFDCRLGLFWFFYNKL